MPRIAAFGCALLLSLCWGTAAAFELMTFPAASAGGNFAMPATGTSRAVVAGAALLAAQPATPVTLTAPSGKTYTFILERRVTHSADSVTWTGVLQGQSNDYRMLLTYSPAASFGSFTTPDGNLILETVDNQTTLVDPDAAGGKRFVSTVSDAIPPPRRSKSPANAVPPVGEVAPSPQTTIDVLVLYSPGLVTRIGSVAGALARINFLITLSNQAYFASDIAVTLRLLQATQINGVVDNTDNGVELDGITNGTGLYGGVLALRDAIGADMVTLMRPFLVSQVSCGIAWINGYNGNGASIGAEEAYGYSVISDGRDPPTGPSYSYCLDTTYPHELGHNMGSMHDRTTDAGAGFTGAYPYSWGYGVNNVFTTVMAYTSSFGNPTPLAKFSNPNLTCFGVPCGVPSANPASADNAQSINNTRAGVASWRAPVVRTLPPSAEAQTRTMQAAGGFPVTEWFDFSPRANRSYELQLINVSSTTNLAAAGNVARFDAVGLNQLQDSACLDAGCTTRTLRWMASADTNERLRVANGAAAPAASATYTVQFRETTLYCPRWSETSGQSSTLSIQRAQSELAASCNGTAYFFDEAGTQVGSQAFAFAANKVNVQALATIAGLPGAKGSLRIAHTCGIGGLKGIVTEQEPSTGFSFGTPCAERAR